MLKNKKVIYAIVCVVVVLIALFFIIFSFKRKSDIQGYEESAGEYIEDLFGDVTIEDIQGTIEETESTTPTTEYVIPEYEEVESFDHVQENSSVPEVIPYETFTRTNDGKRYVDANSIYSTFDPSIRNLCVEAFSDDDIPLQDTYMILEEIGFKYPVAYYCDSNSYLGDGFVEANILLQECRAKVIISKNGDTYETKFRIMNEDEYVEEAG